MPDPVDPAPPPPPLPTPSPEAAPSADPSSMDLPPNVAAALACIPLIGGIVFYVIEKRNGFVRFYAMQSILFGIAWVLLSIACAIVAGVFGAIPGIGGILAALWHFLSWLVSLGLFVIMVIAMVKAFTNVRWDIPYIGPIARKQLEGNAV